MLPSTLADLEYTPEKDQLYQVMGYYLELYNWHLYNCIKRHKNGSKDCKDYPDGCNACLGWDRYFKLREFRLFVLEHEYHVPKSVLDALDRE